MCKKLFYAGTYYSIKEKRHTDTSVLI